MGMAYPDKITSAEIPRGTNQCVADEPGTAARGHAPDGVCGVFHLGRSRYTGLVLMFWALLDSSSTFFPFGPRPTFHAWNFPAAVGWWLWGGDRCVAFLFRGGAFILSCAVYLHVHASGIQKDFLGWCGRFLNLHIRD